MSADNLKKQLELLKKLKFSDREIKEQILPINEKGLSPVGFRGDGNGMFIPEVSPTATPEAFESAFKTLNDYKNPTTALEFLRNQAGVETRPVIKPPTKSSPVVLPELSIESKATASKPVEVKRKPAEEIPEEVIPEVREPKTKTEIPDDTELLAEAQSAVNTNQLGAALLASGNLINQGLTLSPVDNRAVEALKPGINAPLDAFKRVTENRANNIKLQSAAMDLDNEKELNDPNSDISITARNTLMELGMPVPETTSAGALKAAGVNVGTLIAAKEQARGRRDQMEMLAGERKLSRELREEQIGDIREQRKVTNIGKLQDGFNKDKLAVKALEGLSSAEDADALLDSNTPISDEAVKRSVSRLAGEVGVLTDQDVAAFGGSKAAYDKVKQLTDTLIDGKLTKENREYLRTIIQVFKKRRNEQLNNRALMLAEQGANRLKIDVKDAYEALRPGTDFPEEKVVVVRPDGKQGRIPKSQLESALSQGYKVSK